MVSMMTSSAFLTGGPGRLFIIENDYVDLSEVAFWSGCEVSLPRALVALL